MPPLSTSPRPTTEPVRVDPRVDPVWAELVEARGDVFHTPAWLRVLATAYDLEPTALLLHDDDGSPRAGLAYADVDDPAGPRRIALPFSDYADPLLAAPADWDALATTWLAAPGLARIRCLFADAPLADRRLDAHGWAYWHATDLERAEDASWTALDSGARRAIRRAERAGVTVRPARDEDDLRVFHELHVRLRKHKYRLLAQPYAFFRAMWSEFLARDHGALLLAEHEGRVCAGVLLLEACDKLYYKMNASDPAHLDLRPNDLLVWEALRHGRSRGLRHLDFGVSDHDQPGLVRYKRKFATREERVTFLQRPAAAPAPFAAQWRGLLGSMTTAFTDPDVPEHVAARAGDELYRYFV